MQDGSFLPKDRLHKTSYTLQGIAVVPSSAHVMAFPNVVYKALLGLENSSKLYLACHQSKRSKVCEIFIAFTKSQIGEFSV